jgi:hypothetical protein
MNNQNAQPVTHENNTNDLHTSNIPNFDESKSNQEQEENTQVNNEQVAQPEAKEVMAGSAVDFSSEDLNELKTKAGNQFSIGQKATRRAVSMVVVWYLLAHNNEEYLAESYKGLPDQSNTNPLSNAIRFCLGMSEVQKPSISKYTRVMEYCILKLGKGFEVNVDIEVSIVKVVKCIDDADGFSGCVAKLKELQGESLKSDKKEKPLNADKTTHRLNELKKVVGMTDLSDNEFEEDDMVIVIGRYNYKEKTVDIVDAFKNEKLLNRVVSQRDVK